MSVGDMFRLYCITARVDLFFVVCVRPRSKRRCCRNTRGKQIDKSLAIFLMTDEDVYLLSSVAREEEKSEDALSFHCSSHRMSSYVTRVTVDMNLFLTTTMNAL